MKLKHSLPVLLLVCLFIAGCDKDSSDEVQYPVWILRVTVRDELNGDPIELCARVVWNYAGSTTINTQTCYHTGNHIVKVWREMDESVVIFYRVEADGYFPSDDISVFFDIEFAETGPGRPGEEVTERATIYLAAR